MQINGTSCAFREYNAVKSVKEIHNVIVLGLIAATKALV